MKIGCSNIPILQTYSVMCPGKRSLEEVCHVEKIAQTKTVKAGIEGTAKSVSEFGTAVQQRAAATAEVSPDALRFPPSQVRKSVPIKK